MPNKAHLTFLCRIVQFFQFLWYTFRPDRFDISLIDPGMNIQHCSLDVHIDHGQMNWWIQSLYLTLKSYDWWRSWCPQFLSMLAIAAGNAPQGQQQLNIEIYLWEDTQTTYQQNHRRWQGRVSCGFMYFLVVQYQHANTHVTSYYGGVFQQVWPWKHQWSEDCFYYCS